jgi:hypothetical protein
MIDLVAERALEGAHFSCAGWSAACAALSP